MHFAACSSTLEGVSALVYKALISKALQYIARNDPEELWLPKEATSHACGLCFLVAGVPGWLTVGVNNSFTGAVMIARFELDLHYMSHIRTMS